MSEACNPLASLSMPVPKCSPLSISSIPNTLGQSVFSLPKPKFIIISSMESGRNRKWRRVFCAAPAKRGEDAVESSIYFFYSYFSSFSLIYFSIPINSAFHPLLRKLSASAEIVRKKRIMRMMEINLWKRLSPQLDSPSYRSRFFLMGTIFNRMYLSAQSPEA
jgi:hypothetical protein